MGANTLWGANIERLIDRQLEKEVFIHCVEISQHDLCAQFEDTRRGTD